MKHPQIHNQLQIIQMNGQAERFGLVKPGIPSKIVPICEELF